MVPQKPPNRCSEGLRKTLAFVSSHKDKPSQRTESHRDEDTASLWISFSPSMKVSLQIQMSLLQGTYSSLVPGAAAITLAAGAGREALSPSTGQLVPFTA